MKAVQYQTYGSVNVLHIRQVSAVWPQSDEVRVRVIAGGLNPMDSRLRRGERGRWRSRPLPAVPGADFAGIVEAVGSRVTAVAVGDEVYGALDECQGGALAEQAAVKATRISKKPTLLTWEAAATVPTAACAALQALRDVARIQPGMSVLINGSSGGVGGYAVQLAKYYGARVVGACGSRSRDFVTRLGADRVVDYRKTSIENLQETFDVILDLSGHLSFEQTKPRLDAGGMFIDLNPSVWGGLIARIKNTMGRRKHVKLCSRVRQPDLEWLGTRLQNGELTAHVARTFYLDEVREAYRALERGGVPGKIALRVA